MSEEQLPQYTPTASSSEHRPVPAIISPSPVPFEQPPPEWAPNSSNVPEQVLGAYNEASEDAFERASRFYANVRGPATPRHPTSTEKLSVQSLGVDAWTIATPSTFRSKIEHRHGLWCVESKRKKNTAEDITLTTNMPFAWGVSSFKRPHPHGAYFEVTIDKIGKRGVVAIGWLSHPYPVAFRLPGWHPSSVALHSDDSHLFVESSLGGKPFLIPASSAIPVGSVVGCGIHSANVAGGPIFYTLDGNHVGEDIKGLYFPRSNFDIYPAIGLSADVEVSINLGGAFFAWQGAMQGTWKCVDSCSSLMLA